MTGTGRILLAAGVAVVVLSVASGAGTANESPIAEAGLDQEVPVNGTVYLDATGSSDPDGNIVGYEWSIERPDGSATAPDCRTCARTNFRVRQPGQYNVTVTVTDDDGAEQSDTLRVDVDKPDRPTVDVEGPTAVLINESVEYTATVDAGAAELAKIEWEFGGRGAATRGLDGNDAVDRYSPTFASNETRELTVTVMDSLGRAVTATREVDIAVPDGFRIVDGGITEKGSGGGSGSGGGGGVDSSNNCYIPQSDDPEDYDYYCDNDLKLHDGENQEMTIVDTDKDGNYTYGGVQIDKKYETDMNEMTLTYSQVRNITGMRVEDVGPNNDPESLKGEGTEAEGTLKTEKDNSGSNNNEGSSEEQNQSDGKQKDAQENQDGDESSEQQNDSSSNGDSRSDSNSRESSDGEQTGESESNQEDKSDSDSDRDDDLPPDIDKMSGTW